MRAALYTRISEDRDGQRLGVTRQRSDCEALAERLGWQITHRFDDNDISATGGKRRPGYEKLLAAMAAGEVDAVLCWHPDRLYRSLRDLVRLFDATKTHDVQLLTVNGGAMDLTTATGRMVSAVVGSVSTMEIEHKVERQRAAARQKAERGEPNWTHTPFGYTADRLPDPATAPLVKQAYALILAGGSLADVCRVFNDAGALTVTGKHWTAATVSRYLRRPCLAGLRAYKGAIVGAGTWPGLVDADTWCAAQAVMDAPGRRPGRKSVRRHLLTGVIFCGRCGHHLAGSYVYARNGKTGDKSGDRRVTYVCKGCHRVSIRADQVEPLLYGVVAGRLAEPDAVDLLASAQHDTADAERLRAEAAALHAQIAAAEAEYDEGIIDGRRLAGRTEAVGRKLDEITRAQHDAEKVRVFDGIPLGTPKVEAAIEGLSPDRFRAVLDVLCTVTVAPVGKHGKTFNPERVKVSWR